MVLKIWCWNEGQIVDSLEIFGLKNVGTREVLSVFLNSSISSLNSMSSFRNSSVFAFSTD